MKHTKGEWRRGHIHGDEFPNHTHVYSELGLNADGVMVIKTIAYLPKRGTPEETSADGFLMAAAPDLLEALEKAMDSLHFAITEIKAQASIPYDDSEMMNERYEAGLDAINKAKGLTK